MNSAKFHNPMKSDQGTEVRKPYLARGFKRTTSGEATELLCERAHASDPKVQRNFDEELRADTRIRKQCSSLDRWVSHGPPDG